MDKGRASEQHRFKSVLQKNGKINGGGKAKQTGAGTGWGVFSRTCIVIIYPIDG